MKAMLAGAIVVLGLAGCTQTQSDPHASDHCSVRKSQPAVPGQYPQCSGHAHDSGDHECDETVTKPTATGAG